MNICVYGASSNNIDKSYIIAMENLGEEMAKRGHTLVFGGGANQDECAVFDGGQKGILLRFVETMDFIYEQDRRQTAGEQ